MTTMKNNPQNLLNQIRDIVQKEKDDRECQKQNGNSFNLFNVLNIKTDELIHSLMIASLLDPHADHGKGCLFLQKFLNIWDFGFVLDTRTTSVTTEYEIGTLNSSSTRGGRIDILITDAHNHAIIIENKINAQDQKNQLKRYANFAKSSKFEYTIIYLTLDGHEPSELSTGKNFSEDYVMFSYQEDILPWLDKCKEACVAGSALHNSISQYSQCLRKILNLMNKDNEDRLLEIATQKENIASVLALFANENTIKRKVIDAFVEELCDKARELGFETCIDEGFCEEKETFITFSIPSQSDKWALFIGTNKRNAKDMYYCISSMEGALSKIKKADLMNIPHLWRTFDQDNNTPCGWSFLWSESGKKYSGKWYDWHDTETQQAMVDGRLLKYITDNVFIPIIESKVLATLDKF